jgi:hypothetical protein
MVRKEKYHEQFGGLWHDQSCNPHAFIILQALKRISCMKKVASVPFFVFHLPHLEESLVEV